MFYYSKTISDIFAELKTGELGLSQSEAEKRLKEFGLNKLPEVKGDSLIAIFLRQFQSSLIYILIIAALVVFFIGEITDSLIILAILFFNAFVGTIQEGRAQNTLAVLKKFIETQAVVLRDGKEEIISDAEIVVGDIIFLREGERAPADCRIIISNNLKVDQAALTGESEPIFKIAEQINKNDLAIADQENMVFKGTHIVSGNGKAIIVAIGINTEIGKIGKEISLIDKEIPLQKDIEHLARMIIYVVAAISAFLFSSGFFLFEKSFKEMFSMVVALSVSVIPEGLPIVITLVLTTGVWRMAKQNALVKRLQAVEALGQAKIIAVDKTGTITKNELVIRKVFVDGKMFEISGVGYEPKGEIRLDGQLISAPDYSELIFAGKMAAFCANAKVAEYKDEKSGQISYRVSGDPTEAAVLILSQKLGFQKEIIDAQHQLIEETPFDYKTKYHASLRKIGDKKFLTIVGAPENVFDLCYFSKKQKEEAEQVFHKMSREGLRVLAFAYKEDDSKIFFGGFYGIKDALRSEVKESVKKALEAGLKVVMITGDHKLTAEAIAKDAGIFKKGDKILTGEEIDALSDGELADKLNDVSVFARVTPEHKLRIVKAYKKRGEIIAMTGDGVNDAPALVAADLGLAMGKIGTEVAKEASDIILLDDNFQSIIAAIEEGRSIYKTIKKVILYLFSTSLGEVLTIIGALFLGYPLPLLAGQIIWLNFVTDGFLDVALAMEPKEKNLLKNWKRGASKHLVDYLMAKRMIVMALPMAIGGLFIFKNYFEIDMQLGLTMSLTTLAIFQWFNAWNCRSEEKSIFQINPFSNKWLIGALFIVISLQLLAVYHPMMQKILHTVSLELSDWLFAAGIAFSIIIAEEIRKFFYRRLNAIQYSI